MSAQEREIIDRCKQLGLDDGAHELIRRFIDAAFHHAYHPKLPTLPKADRHVAVCSALRNVSGRIACQWKQPGRVKDHCRNLSARAVARRNELAEDAELKPAAKFALWSREVTIEHHDPVAQLFECIDDNRPDVDTVVARVLKYPIAIITWDEDVELNKKGFRKSGGPEVRYAGANITLEWQDKGTLDFFFDGSGSARRKRRSKYDQSEVAIDFS